MMPVTTEREAEIDSLRRRIESIQGRALPQPDALAARARGPSSRAAERARVRRACSSPSSPRSTATAASATITRSSTGMARFKDEPVLVVGHHKGGATRSRRSSGTSATRRPEGYRKALRAMQMAQKFNRPDHGVRGHARRVPGHRVGRARHRRGDRVEPARDGDARRAHHRERLRRRRQRRRAGPRDRRSHSDARVRGLLGHSAGRLRRDSLARQRAQDRGGRSPEADRTGSLRRAASSTRSFPSRSAAPTRTPRPRRRCSIGRWSRRLPLRPAGRPPSGSTPGTRSSGAWAGSAQDFADEASS